jgi:hypothetical protein
MVRPIAAEISGIYILDKVAAGMAQPTGERDVTADCGVGALDKADAPRLRFNSQNDALDFASHCVENGNRWLATHDIHFSKRYEEGEIDLVLELTIGADATKYHLVLFAIPPWDRQSAGRQEATTKIHPSDSHFCGQKTVLASVTKLIECPDKVIASFVRIERAKERYDVRRDILASSFDASFKSDYIVCDREVGGFGVNLPVCDGCYESGLIEPRSEPFDNFIGEIRQTVWQGLCELNLVKLVDSIRIGLDDPCVWLVIEKPLDPGIEITNVALCARDAPLGAGEPIVAASHASSLIYAGEKYVGVS